MAKARISNTPKGQLVHLPAGFRFDGDTVEVFRRGEEIVLRGVHEDMTRAFELLANLPEDFLEDGRGDTPPHEREDM